MPFWGGFLLVSAAFGSVHVFNAILTGELAEAGVQALNAFMSGAAYLALRIRTRLIIPIMVIHTLWDFTVFLVGSGATGPAPEPAPVLQRLTFGQLLTGPLSCTASGWCATTRSVPAGAMTGRRAQRPQADGDGMARNVHRVASYVECPGRGNVSGS